jgi:carboxyl-terminal processing protease
LQIVAPIAGSPAEKAGLKAGDLITQINGESTTNIQIDDAVTKIRGQKGTTVKLQIVRDGAAQDITVTRDEIKVASVTSKTLDGNIGYIQITQFSDDTAELVRTAARGFVTSKVNGIVLDMRSNPGGLLNAAVSVSSLWLPSGTTVLQEKRGNEVVQTYTASGDPLLKGMKTVVLIDGGSASASEITAGALKDNNAATLIGVKS